MKSALGFDIPDDASPIGRPRMVKSALGFDVPDGMMPISDEGDTSRGFKRAFAQLPELGYGAAALAAESAEKMFGEGGISTAARDYFSQKFTAKQVENQQYTPTVEFTDAWDKLKQGDVGSMVDWLQDSAGYVVGQGVQTLAMGGIGALAGKVALRTATEKMLGGLVAKQATKIAEETAIKQGLTGAAMETAVKGLLPEATKQAASGIAQAIGAGTALAAQNLGMEAGDIYGSLMERKQAGENISGYDLLRAWGGAAAAAGTETATDLLGLGALTGRIRIGNKTIQGMPGLVGRAARGATAAAIGVPVESGQEWVQTWLEQWGAGKPTDTPEAARERINAAAVGGLGGVVMGGGIGAFQGARAAPPAPAPLPDVTPILQSKNVDEAIAKTGEVVAAPIPATPLPAAPATQESQLRNIAFDALEAEKAADWDRAQAQVAERVAGLTAEQERARAAEQAAIEAARGQQEVEGRRGLIASRMQAPPETAVGMALARAAGVQPQTEVTTPPLTRAQRRAALQPGREDLLARMEALQAVKPQEVQDAEALLDASVLKRAVEGSSRDMKQGRNLAEILPGLVQRESGIKIPTKTLAGIVSESSLSTKDPINSATGHTEFIGNLLQGIAALPEFQGIVEIPASLSRSGGMVKAHMLGGADNFKILQGIVKRVPVFVVNMLSRKQLSTNGVLDNNAMQKTPTPFTTDLTVLGNAIGSSHTSNFTTKSSNERQGEQDASNAIRSDEGQVRQGGQEGQPGLQPSPIEGRGNLQQPAPEAADVLGAPGRGTTQGPDQFQNPIAPKTVAGTPVSEQSTQELRVLAASPETPANTRHAAAAAVQVRLAQENREPRSPFKGGGISQIPAKMPIKTGGKPQETPISVQKAVSPFNTAAASLNHDFAGNVPSAAQEAPRAAQPAAPAQGIAGGEIAKPEPALQAPIQQTLVETFAGRYGKGMNEVSARQQMKEIAKKRPELEWRVEPSKGLDYPFVINGYAKATPAVPRQVEAAVSAGTPESVPVTGARNQIAEPVRPGVGGIALPESTQADLRRFASEAGWEERGGRIIREGETGEGGMIGTGGAVVGRTKWIPKQEWFQRMRQELGVKGLYGERDINKAVEQYLAGEKLKPIQQRTVDWMLAEIQAERKAGEEAAVPVAQTWDLTDEEMKQLGWEGVRQDSIPLMESMIEKLKDYAYGKPIETLVEDILERSAIVSQGRGLYAFYDEVYTRLREVSGYGTQHPIGQPAQGAGRANGENRQGNAAQDRGEARAEEGAKPAAEVAPAKPAAEATPPILEQPTPASLKSRAEAEQAAAEQKAKDEAAVEKARAGRPVKADQVDLFQTQGGLDLTRPAAELSPADLLRAAADKLDQTTIPQAQSVITQAQQTIPQVPVADAGDDQIRAIMGLDKTKIDAYDPSAAVRKVGPRWSYDTWRGNSHPGIYDTRREATEAAQRHKNLALEQYDNPSGFYDVTSMLAEESLKRINAYMKAGMSEMEAGEKVRAEVPGNWRPGMEPATKESMRKSKRVPLSKAIEASNKRNEPPGGWPAAAPKETPEAATKEGETDKGVAMFARTNEGVHVNADDLSKGVLARMDMRLKSLGYDSRGSDDVRTMLKTRIAPDGVITQPDWIAAYEAAVKGAQRTRERIDAKAAERGNASNVDFARMRELGLTEDWREAGYITQRGSLIDLSGKREGGERGVRSYDHREAGGTIGMQEYMALGNIRIDANSKTMDISREPTPAQYRLIAEFAENSGGEITLDVEDGLGELREGYYSKPERTFSREYPIDTRPARIVADIRRFFAGEEPLALPRPKFAKGQGVGITESALRSEISKAFGPRAERMVGDILIPLQTQAEIANRLPDVAKLIREGDRVSGFHDPKTGKTYAILENLAAGEVKGLALHEIGVHYGFEGMLGKERYAQVLKQVDVMRRTGNKAVVEAHEQAVKQAASQSQVPEETLAYMVSNQPQTGFVKRLIAEIKAFLFRKFGILGDRLTPDDIAALARASVLRASESVKNGEPVFSRTQDQTQTPETNPDIRFSRSIAGTLITGDVRDTMAQQSTQFLRDYLKGFDKLSLWQKTVGTPFHLAETNAEFRPVYDEGQSFLNDVSRYGNESADLAKSLLPRIEGFRDFGVKSANRQDIDNVQKALYAGTLWGGGSPLEGRIWTDEELSQGRAIDGSVSLPAFQPLNQQQISLYRQALAATANSMDNLAKSLIHRLVRGVGIGFDRSMSLNDIASDVRQQINDRLDEVRLRIEAAVDTTTEAAKADRRLFDTLQEMRDQVRDINYKATALRERGYFPAIRFGRYALHVVQDGEQQYFGLYENKIQAILAKRALAKEFPAAEIQQSVIPQEKYRLFQGLSLDALETFSEYITDEKGRSLAKDALVQAFLKAAVSERSVMKRHIHRKGIAGYSTDIPRVLAAFVVSSARATASNYHTAEMLKLVNDIASGDVSDYATKLVRYLNDPQEEAHNLRGFLFAQYLGGSIASGLVNITQPFLVTAPHLSQYSSFADAWAKLSAAATDNPAKLTGQIRRDFDRAKAEGIVSPQEIHQLRADTGGGISGRSLALRKLSFAWGSIFSLAEQFNRKTTFLAAYRIAEEQGIDNPYEFAKEQVAATQFTYNKGNRPVFGRGMVGATVMTFKQFSISYLEMAKRLYKTDKVAFSLLVLTLMAAAGLEGLPFAEDIEDLIDTIGQWMGYATNSKKQLRQFVNDTLGKELGQIALRGISGLPFMPMDISARLGMANLIPGTAMLKPSEKDKGRDVLELAGPIGQFVPTENTTLGRALDRLWNADLLGLMKSGVLTRSAASIAQGAEMLASGQYKDIRGRKIADTTPGEAVLKMAGLQPASIARQQQRESDIRQDIDLHNRREGEIAEKWARGIVDKDREQVRSAMQDMARWNRDNPDLRIRITQSQIQSRVKALRMSREERTIKSTPPEMRRGVREALRQ